MLHQAVRAIGTLNDRVLVLEGKDVPKKRGRTPIEISDSEDDRREAKRRRTGKERTGKGKERADPERGRSGSSGRKSVPYGPARKAGHACALDWLGKDFGSAEGSDKKDEGSPEA